MFIIDYGTRAGNETAINLDDAIQTANHGASYTGEDIKIIQEGEIIAIRKWSATRDLYDEMNDPIVFGMFGYYADWEVLI